MQNDHGIGGRHIKQTNLQLIRKKLIICKEFSKSPKHNHANSFTQHYEPSHSIQTHCYPEIF